MHLQTYSQWRETCIALHMVAQMMGKVKLECLEPQPEWGHVLLEPVPDGFSTGFVPPNILANRSSTFGLSFCAIIKPP